MQKKLNRAFSGSMIFYFAMFSAMFSFISVYLLSKGFENTTIGTVLSITGILSIFIQTAVADFLDKHPSIRLQNTVSIYTIFIIPLSLLLYLAPANFIMLFLIILIFSLAQSSETLLNALAFVFERFGIQINYGIARGLGSLSFAIGTLFIGFIVEATTPNILPLFYVLFAIGLLLCIRAYRHPEEEMFQGIIHPDDPKPEDELEATETTLTGFLKRNKRLVLLMIGLSGFLFTHSVINNFFIQIISPIGGNNASMGVALFVGAIVELPAMFHYDKIEQKIPVHQLLIISGIFYLIKHILTYFAPNMTVIYIAQLFQIGAFALMYPAAVSYIRSAVARKDLIKGQSLFTTAMAVGSVAGSFLGGILLDEAGVSFTLFIGILATVIGIAIVLISLEKQPVKQSKLN